MPEGTYGSGSSEVLSEQNSLGLNHEEVDEFVDVTNQAVKSLAGEGVVSARAHLGGEAIVQDELASRLGSDGNTKGNPGQLEGPADQVEVSSSEDEGDDGSVGNAGSTYDTHSKYGAWGG